MLPVAAAALSTGVTAAALLHHKHSRLKPQRRFKVHLTDNSDAPFRHLRRPAAIGATQHDPAAAVDETQPNLEQHVHPYAAEIQQLMQHPACPALLAPAAAAAALLSPPPLESTSLLWVNTPRRLQAMLSQLAGVTVIALDTEHNAQRSYLGLTCLLQLSTGSCDYLVDCIALHDQLHLLRQLLADPGVLKVVHGGGNDVIWLQRDAQLYLVNIFDTEKAAQVLGRQELSLANLLRLYCGVSPDKTHQTADWRVRPLPPTLQRYARSDVHWLIHLAAKLAAELQARSPSTTGDALSPGPLLTSTLQKSNGLSLRLYAKTPAELAVSNSLAAALRRLTHTLHIQQQQQQPAAANGVAHGVPVVAAAAAAPALDHVEIWQLRDRLAQVIAWRDSAARADDEGVQYILPDAALFELVQRPPASARQLLAVVQRCVKTLNASVAHLRPCAPSWAVSPAIKRSAKQLVQLLNQDAAAAAGTAAAAAAGGGPAAGGATATAAHGASSLLLSGGHGVMVAGSLAAPVDLGGLLAAAAAGDADAAAAAVAAAAAAATSARKQNKASSEFRQRLIRKFSAKTQVYDNCRMLSTSGELLCFCDMRKLQWYVDKGLAQQVSDDPPTIRLLFEHKISDQQVGLDGFYSTSRANRCVVCGQEQHYLRFRVVPSCYRRCFPAHLKSHRSHDIVLLCIDCHQEAHKATEAIKRALAAEYGVPLQPLQAAIKQQHQQQQLLASAAGGGSGGSRAADEEHAAVEEDELPLLLSSYQGDVASPVSAAALAHQARGSAVALLRFGDAIPQQRRQQLEQVIASFLGRPAAEAGSISQSDIESALLAGLNEKQKQRTLQKLRGPINRNRAAAVAAEGADGSGVGARRDAGAAAAAGTDDESSGGDADDGADITTRSAEVREVAGGAGAQQQQQQWDKAPSLTEGHAWHGQQVVAAIMAKSGEDGLHSLVSRFRLAFVLACKPRYLPKAWDVATVDTREFGDFSVYAREEAAAATAAAAGAAAAAIEAFMGDSSACESHNDDGLSIFSRKAQLV